MDSVTAPHPLHPQLVTSIIEGLARASALQASETDAALKVQAAYRMWRDRRSYQQKKSAVVCMQRMYRGHMQRKRVMGLREIADLSHERAVYEYYAARIQACFRGFYVRRYVDNFYARKRYIERTMKVSADVRDMGAQMLEEQILQATVTRLSHKDESYREATEKLHHMLSTVSVSGVYRHPVEPTAAETIYGTKVEDDIRRHTAAVRRPQHVRKVRERLKAFATEGKRDATSLVPATKHDSTKYSQPQAGDVDKGQDNIMHFTVLHGAWNRRHVEGCSLPPIAGASAETKKGATRSVVSHSCIEDFSPLYDTESAELARRVDTKGMQALHGSKPFVVPTTKRVPL
ncbi:putative spermatogenesis-associated protein 17-like [Trypanosoma grayi]|uniref:putative spermatogenesis-associated protein 17-like n=1 Tax=Trypanosoma grayi TaxID=71804 RepID=UPI0004F48F40|nr:putative spermatogenesis-associated protein 17-like [Trypanosoma grayi]KEG09439.1 putative spermatogenesis-associated protein 17-like [Trypanosoma grayi]